MSRACIQNKLVEFKVATNSAGLQHKWCLLISEDIHWLIKCEDDEMAYERKIEWFAIKSKAWQFNAMYKLANIAVLIFSPIFGSH